MKNKLTRQERSHYIKGNQTKKKNQKEMKGNE